MLLRNQKLWFWKKQQRKQLVHTFNPFLPNHNIFKPGGFRPGFFYTNTFNLVQFITSY